MQRSVVNQSILKAIKSKNEKLDEEIFGAKSKLQYKPKQSNTGEKKIKFIVHSLIRWFLKQFFLFKFLRE